MGMTNYYVLDVSPLILPGYGEICLRYLLLNSPHFFVYEAPPTAFFAANTVHDNYLKHCTLWSTVGKMAASSNSLLTEEDISIVLDKEDKSNVFCEESDEFSFDTSEEDSEGESDTSSVVHESEPYEEVSDFLPLFGPCGMACPRFAFFGVSGVNVDLDDETSVLECL
jgi:hypothetical protein